MFCFQCEQTAGCMACAGNVGEVNLGCMAMLDKANTETFGHPEPTEVSLTIESGETVMTGFARNTVMSVAGTVIDAVKVGAIKHFFLAAGCPG